MAQGINVALLTGRLGSDPEIRFTQTGKAKARMRLAVTDYPDRTNWLTVIAWEKLAELAQQLAHKGDLITVQGRIDVREFETDAGEKRTATEIVAAQIVFAANRAISEVEARAAPPTIAPQRAPRVEDDVPF